MPKLRKIKRKPPLVKVRGQPGIYKVAPWYKATQKRERATRSKRRKKRKATQKRMDKKAH